MQRLSLDRTRLCARVGTRCASRVDVAVSDRGDLLYISGSERELSSELVWVDRKGAFTSVDSAWRLGFGGRISISPDGRFAASAVMPFSPQPQIWIKRLDRGPASKLSVSGLSPSWTPDGREIVFASDSTLYRGPVDGSRVPAAIRHLRFRVAAVELSPDGRWVLLQSAGNVYAMRIDGDTTLVLLATTPAAEVRPALSPDGRYFAYQSDETGRSEIYVRPFPGADAAKWVVSTEGGLFPRWSRSGRELFFVNDAGALVAVPVTLSPTFAAGIPSTLFNLLELETATAFESSRDGSRFLVARRSGLGGGTPSELVLVQHFSTELRAKAKP